MKKKDFVKLIEDTHTRLIGKDVLNNREYYGICIALRIAVNNETISFQGQDDLLDLFAYLTKNTYEHMAYWFGTRDKDNLFRRQIALDLFEQHVLQYKLYKEF